MDREKDTSWLAYVQAMPDPRQVRGKRYSWDLLWTVICAGLASGQKSAWAIARWAKHHAQALCRELNVARIPSYSTLYRVLRYVDVEALEAQVAAYGQAVDPQSPPTPSLHSEEGQRLRGQAVDGKEIRGAKAHGVKVSLLSLVRHDAATILGQQRVPEATNEIGVAPAFFARQDLKGTVTTMDAHFTQRAIAQQVRAQGGHYLMVVKKNQPQLYEDVATLFQAPPWPRGEEDRQAYRYVNSGHGRIEQRTLVCSEGLNAYLSWPGVGQVLQRSCARALLSKGTTSVQTSYAITSLTRAQASAKDLETLWRNHWTIENREHYVRDETLGEDRGQAWKGQTAQALAALRNGLLATLRRQGWTSIADALRYYSGDLHRALRLVGALPA
jgi:predicted transposase YbfD/YdcC